MKVVLRVGRGREKEVSRKGAEGGGEGLGVGDWG